MIGKDTLLKYLKEITDDDEIINRVIDINELRVQGARNVAIESLKIVRKYYMKYGVDNNIYRLIKLLKNLRPTQVITFNVLSIVEKRIKKGGIKIIDDLIKEIELAPKRISRNFLKELIDLDYKSVSIMLHCHSTEVIKSLIKAKEYGFNIIAYVTETRPKMQGILTAKDLLNNNIKVKYIVDSAAGFYMKDVDLFVSGIDSIRYEGIINKIGTYLIALAAKDNKKDVWFVGDYLKIDERKELIIEMRDPKEILDPKEVPGAYILNPAFDITPWRLIDKVITDRGVLYNFSTGIIEGYV